jgi:hypothetical protein
MSNIVNFYTSSTQTSTANQEIIQQNKPEGYKGTFIANSFNFYNVEDCHVIVNGNTNQMNVPAGGYEFKNINQVQTLKIVEAGIHFNYTGTAPVLTVIATPTSGKGLHMLGIMAQPPVMILNEGDTQQITVTAVRPVLYNNSTMPFGTIYESNDEAVATVNTNGIVSYVGSGLASITVSNNGFYDIVNVTCN